MCLGLSAAAGTASDFPPAFSDYAALQESLRYLPPNIRFYELDRPGLIPRTPVLMQAESSGLHLVGKWGAGPSVKVTGRDSILFLSRGSQVVVINHADAANPKILSYMEVNGLVSRSVLVGNRLYVGSTGSDPKYIDVFDVADPANPQRLGQIQTRLLDIDVVDTLVYTVAKDSFRVFNFSDPANPRQLGACRDTGYTLSVCNGYAYIADRWGLFVVDTRDPTSPRHEASWGSNITSVKARGNVCCATLADVNDNLTFYVLDARQPGSIAPLGSLADHGGYDLYLADSLVFVSGYYTGSGHEFQILSVADSLHPRLVGQASTLGDNNGVWADTTGRLAFVADRTEGLQVFDVSMPSNPRRDTALLGAGPSLDIVVHGDIVAVATQSTGLKLVSVANPASPVELGSIDSTYDYPDCDAVELADSFAFMGWQPYPYLRTVLVSDPANPVKVGACQGMQNDAQDMKLRDSLLYMVAMGRLYIVNVARPREPVLVGSLNESGGSLWLADTLAYLASSTCPIVNVASSASPFPVSYFSRGAWDVATVDTVAFLTTGVFVWYDVSDPRTPQVIDSVNLGFTARGLAVLDTIAYTGSLYDLCAVSIADLHNPKVISRTKLPYGAKRITYAAPYLYVACWEAGVCIFETASVGVHDADKAAPLATWLAVRPNPTRSQCEVEGRWKSGSSIIVRDVAGRAVLVPSDRSKSAGKLTLDLSRLEAGVYFLDVSNNERRTSVKLVKQ